MNDFQIGDWVYASDWCYGQIISISDEFVDVEFDIGNGGGTCFFEHNAVTLAVRED